MVCLILGLREIVNVTNDNLRIRQVVNLIAWHYNHHNNTQIYNRGHLIAYSIFSLNFLLIAIPVIIKQIILLK